MENLRKYINLLIKNTVNLPVYFFRANDKASFPYVTWDIEDWGSDDFVKSQYKLNVSVWNKGDTKEAIEAAEKIQKLFKSHKKNNDNFMISTNCDSGFGFVDDTDKDIIQIVGIYNILVIFKED